MKADPVAIARSIILPAIRRAARAARFQRATVPAPATEPTAPTPPPSIATLYELIRAPGGLALLVMS